MRGLRSRFPSEELAELTYLYLTTGASGVIYTWAFGGFKMDREELADRLYQLVMKGLDGWIEKN